MELKSLKLTGHIVEIVGIDPDGLESTVIVNLYNVEKISWNVKQNKYASEFKYEIVVRLREGSPVLVYFDQDNENKDAILKTLLQIEERWVAIEYKGGYGGEQEGL